MKRQLEADKHLLPCGMMILRHHLNIVGHNAMIVWIHGK